MTQVLSRGAGFVSCQAPELIFGLADLEEATLEVLWPGGRREDFGPVAARSRCLLVEGSGQVQSIELESGGLADPLPEGLALRIGERVPELTLVDAKGREQSVDVRQLGQGKPIVLNLWASTCVPCVGELPLLAEMQQGGDQEVVLFSVDDPDARERADAMLQKRGRGLSSYYLRPAGAGLESLVDLVRLPIPTTLFLDPEGVVQRIHRGPIED